MTDHPRDDDLLRAALHAEADDVHADDALHARIRAAAAPPAWRRRMPMLAMAAAVALVAGLAAVLISRDDGDPVVLQEPERSELPTDLRILLGDLIPCGSLPGVPDVPVQVIVFFEPPALQPDADAAAERGDVIVARSVALGAPPIYNLGRSQILEALLDRYPDHPALAAMNDFDAPDGFVLGSPTPDAATALVSELADLPGVWATSVTDCRDHTDTTGTTIVAQGDRPTLVALVREDGWLVTVDLETGEQRELHTEGDPQQPEPGFEEGGPYFIDAVDLSPDGQWIYFSTCCEPADGVTFRIPTSGGEVEQVALGAYPRLSPDGRFLATAGSAHLRVYPTDDLGPSSQPALLEIGCCAKHMAWSPDGSALALIYGTGAEGEVPQVRRFTWDGTTLAEAEMGKPDNPGWFVLWMPDGMPVISNGDPIADDRGRSQDASYGWILWVDEEGVVKEQAGFETGDIKPIPGLPEALSADW